jgi:ribosome recycling factor
MDKSIYKPYEEKMKKSMQVLKEEFASIRAGRANPAILDKITVDYYGVPTPIVQLGNITVPEARIIMIQPWEVKMLKEIEKGGEKLEFQFLIGRLKTRNFLLRSKSSSGFNSS